MFRIACLIGMALALALPRAALAVGEVIRDIRIEDNARTEEETIRSIAGISIGDIMEIDTLESVRERLNTSGLFAEVNVYWVPFRDGVRVNIVIRDKFPWAPVPTLSYAPGNLSAGLVVAHGNLFGRGKRGIIGGRISTADSGALVAYQDPALFGSWIFYQFAGAMQDQTIPEYSNLNFPVKNPVPVRLTGLRSYVFSAKLGIAWVRRVKTSVGWAIDRSEVRGVQGNEMFFPGSSLLPAPAKGGLRTFAEAELTFDFRAREHAVMWGNALSFSLDHGDPRWGGDARFRYWKARVSYEHGIRFLRRHNIILRGGAFAGQDMPFWNENSAGGTNLRGYVHRQFAGDSHLRTQSEYHFPLFSISKLDVRGLVFNDAAAIWYRQLPELDPSGMAYVERNDGRVFLPPDHLTAGFNRRRDVHTSAGLGLRFFLRSVAVPLVGIDAGYALPEGPVRIVLMVGA
jgi:outer membrane protein insertion porin family